MSKIFQTITHSKEKEQGAAIIFSVMGSLIVLALAYMLMLSTTQNLTVAFFTNNDSKLTTMNSAGVNLATSLINNGYDYTQHDETNPYVRTTTKIINGKVEIIEKTEWYVEPFDISNTDFCETQLAGHTPGLMETLIVGGGGSGGGSIGGGGGAGGFLEIMEDSSEKIIITAGEYPVIVGAGGAPATSQEAGTSGQDSSVFGKTALGGGGGAAVLANDTVLSATPGGSGGGATNSGVTSTINPGGLGTSGQGNRGGDSVSLSSSPVGSGGGGAGSTGVQALSSFGGNGGDGLASSITGEQTFYAAGGGGAAESTTGTAGSGGVGGGGSGGLGESPGGDALPNTGSGGGGAYAFSNTLSGAGASGIVVIRYPTEINGNTTNMLATGGTIEEITLGSKKYNVHIFTEAGESTFNLISSGERKYNCGLNLYVKSSMPYYSDTAYLKTLTILTPFEFDSASISNGVITYSPSKTSLLRGGIHALNELNINNDVKIYSYYSSDDIASSSPLLSSLTSLNSASLSSQKEINIDSAEVSVADFSSINLYHDSGSTPSTYQHAACMIGILECPALITNKQNFKISTSEHNSWLESVCDSPLVSFGNAQTIPEGITCVDASITLGNNTVLGTYENPSILIVDGNITFTENASLNLDKPARQLQIYTTGSVVNNSEENSTSYINAIIVATGASSNITLEELNSTSTLTFAGSMFSSNNINLSGNIEIWHDLNTKFIKNPQAKLVYQKNITDNIQYIPEPFNIANLGTTFGEEWTPDTTQGNANTPNNGGE